MPLSGPVLERHADVARLLQGGRAEGAGRLALAGPDGRWTFEGLEDAVRGLAAVFAGRGLAPGDRIATLLPNSGALVIVYLAAAGAGLTVAPLNWRFVAAEVAHAVRLFRPALVIADPDRRNELAEAAASGAPAFDVLAPEEAVAAGGRPPAADHPPPDPDRPLFVFFTSGSTGPSKGATHTGRTIGAMTGSLVQSLRIGPDDVFLAASSLSHQGGINVALATLAAGAGIAVPETNDPDDLIAALRTYRPTLTFLLPATLARLVASPGATRADFASLRYLSVGGDRMPAEVGRALEELAGLPVREGYGMSEVGGSNLTPPDGPVRPGSIGPLMPGFEAMVADPSGHEVARGETGRFLVRAPSLMVGYWRDRDATEASFEDGWFDTGDLVSVDADGWFRFRGRAKDIIVRDGLNISPEEVEDVLLSHPAVAAAGVVGVPDPPHGERVRAYVVWREGVARPEPDAVADFARALIGLKAPQEILAVDALPRSPVGKLDRRALRRPAPARAWDLPGPR